MDTTHGPSEETRKAHPELFDAEYAAEQQRLGRRRMFFVMFLATLLGAGILSAFVIHKMVYGKRLPITKQDRQTIVSATTISDSGAEITIRLDAQKIEKHQNRYGQITLTYEYEDGPLTIDSTVEVLGSKSLAVSAFDSVRAEQLALYKDKEWEFVFKGCGHGNRCAYGSIIIDSQKSGHFFVMQIADRLVRCEMLGVVFPSDGQLESMIGSLVSRVQTYDPVEKQR